MKPGAQAPGFFCDLPAIFPGLPQRAEARIFARMTLAPLGDSALVLSWGSELNDAVLGQVRAVANTLRNAKLPGVLDIVPAFATVTLYYDITHIGGYGLFEARVRELAGAVSVPTGEAEAGRIIEIPVCYGGEYGPDLVDVAQRAGISTDEVVQRHTNAVYRVHALGFVPGFAYLGGLPRELHAPRRPTPRASVPAGSVGIGGEQTGIYPLATPGGWNLIGRTPLVLFELTRAEPATLRMGDRVRFRAIAPEALIAWK